METPLNAIMLYTQLSSNKKLKAGYFGCWGKGHPDFLLYSLSTDTVRPAEIFQHFLFLFQRKHVW